jgi:hypothetical protein
VCQQPFQVDRSFSVPTFCHIPCDGPRPLRQWKRHCWCSSTMTVTVDIFESPIFQAVVGHTSPMKPHVGSDPATEEVHSVPRTMNQTKPPWRVLSPLMDWPKCEISAMIEHSWKADTYDPDFNRSTDHDGPAVLLIDRCYPTAVSLAKTQGRPVSETARQ